MINKIADEVRKQSVDFYSFVLIILVALSTRIYISFYSGLPWYTIDTYNYFKMADAILAGHPVSGFPNGYPIFIAITKSIFKPEVVPNFLIVINVVLSTLVVGLNTDITKKVTGSGLVACVAGLCTALYPNQINYVRMLLTEVPTTFLLTLSIWLLLKRKYFISGLTFYLAVLFRSSLLLILPILFVYGLFHLNERIIKVHGIRYLEGFGIGFAFYSMLFVANIVKPSNNMDANLLISISCYSQNVDFSAKDFTSDEKQHPVKTYIKFALDNPIEYMKQRIFSLQQLWGWPASGEPPRGLAAKVLIAVRLPLLIFAIIGFLRRIKDIDAWVLFVPVIAITIVHVAMFSTARFTYVVEPVIIILAAICLQSKIYKMLSVRRFF